MAEESMRDEAVRYQAMATYVCCAFFSSERPLIRSFLSTPLNKIAEPEEVAIQVAFLASHRVAGHTTGQVVMIHGGMEGTSLSLGFRRSTHSKSSVREIAECKAMIRIEGIKLHPVPDSGQ